MSTTPKPWPAAQLALLQQLLADPETPECVLRPISYVINRVQGTAKRLGLKRQSKAPRVWPAAQLALLERLLADPATTANDVRAINFLITRIQGAAKRLGKSEHQATNPRSSRPPLREAALQAIAAAEPHGISPQDLLPLLPTRSGISNLHGLLSDLYAAQLVWRRKLGHRVVLHTSRETRDAAAAALAQQAAPPVLMPRAGSLRAELADAVATAGAAGLSLDEICALPRFANKTRLQLCLAGYKLLAGGVLHSTGMQRTLRYFATAELAEAHAATLPTPTRRNMPTHPAAIASTSERADTPATATLPQRRALTGAERRQRAEGPADGAGVVHMRRVRKEARAANAAAAQLVRQRAQPVTAQPAPVVIKAKPERSEPIIPPGLKPTVLPGAPPDRRYTVTGPVRGGFSDAGIGRHLEPCSRWAQAVTSTITATEQQP